MFRDVAATFFTLVSCCTVLLLSGRLRSFIERFIASFVKKKKEE